jgi:hypothetical protein
VHETAETVSERMGTNQKFLSVPMETGRERQNKNGGQIMRSMTEIFRTGIKTVLEQFLLNPAVGY